MGGSKTENSKNGHLSFRGLNCSKGSKIFKSQSNKAFKGISFTVPNQKTFQCFKRAPKGLKFSTIFNELKAHTLECLYWSVRLRIAFLLVAVQGAHHRTATTARFMLGIRLECGPKWMVDRCPHSLHNPSLRLSPTTSLQITIYSARSHQFA